MSEPRDARWYLAQRLDERVASWRRAGSPFVDEDLARAERRLARWKRTAAFPEILKAHALEENELLRLLGEGEGTLRARAVEAPHWLQSLGRALSARAPGEASAPSALAPGLVRAAWPLVHAARERLRAEIETLAPDGGLDPERVLASLERPLVPGLTRKLRRAMVLETNVSRLEGTLSGETPDDRYRSFLRAFDETSRCEAFFLEYPVLARHCVTYLDHWRDASIEFLHRFADDFEALGEKLGLAIDGPLVEVVGGAGDAHKRGRSVFLLAFEGGQRLVYKPRPLAADAAFQCLLAWMREQGHSPSHQTFRLWDRGAYGWTEWVRYSSCETPAEIERFYERVGSLLALLYSIAGTDLHLENLIACGEFPVVIDLETLFHPLLASAEPRDADDIARLELLDSVLAVGLLPSPGRASGEGGDTSGLAATPNAVLPFEHDGLEEAGTDRVRIRKVPARLGEVRSRPRLKGAAVDVDVADHLPALERGLASTYRFLSSRRELWEASDGPIATFRSAPVRAVLRPSSFYASLLAESYHPTLLRNGMDQEWLLSQLWDEVPRCPAYTRVIASERRQLLDGDIPYFSTYPGARDLVGGDGSELPGALDRAGIEVARERVARMSEADLAFQIDLVRASFADARKNTAPLAGTRAASRHFATFLEEAVAIGERLRETAVRDEKTASWTCLKLVGSETAEGGYRLGTPDLDLYSGLSGITLFLAYLSSISGDESYRDLAEATLRTVEGRLDRLEAKGSPGAFNGLAGLVYLYTHLAGLWRSEAFSKRAVDRLPQLARLLEGEAALDVIGGSAGCIPVLLALHALHPQSDARALARACGERLAAALPEPGLRYPRGFAHGLSGVAWALVELGDATGESRFLSAATSALEQERALLADGIWTDIPGNERQAAWCHGAPGIALSRLAIYRRQPSEIVRRDAERALDYLLAAPASKNHSLCHGTFGNLEPLAAAADLFREDPRWAREYDARKAEALRELGEGSARSALPAALAEPGLMMGLSGIGLGLLRLSCPDRVPCVLRLESFVA